MLYPLLIVLKVAMGLTLVVLNWMVGRIEYFFFYDLFFLKKLTAVNLDI